MKLSPSVFNAERNNLLIWGILIALILTNIALAIHWVPDYGVTMDEPSDYLTAYYRIRAYRDGSLPEDFFIHNKYSTGGSYFVLGKLVSEVIQRLIPQWDEYQDWHFTNFLFFQLGGVFLFLLSRRFTGSWASLGAVLLFWYQPVLWGHAFFNPKDSPFMVLMLASVTSSIYASDHFQTTSSKLSFLKSSWFWITIAFSAVTCAARAHGIIVFGAVGVIWIFRGRKTSIIPFLVMLVFSIAIGFTLWPDLWAFPVETYLHFLRNVVSFSSWSGNILFKGEIYNKANYPRSFLPTLLSFKFTEILLCLMLLGVIGGILQFRARKGDPLLLGILFIWLFIPIFLAIALHPIIYNNIRQFLFILPPAFIFAAIGLEMIFNQFRQITQIWQVALVILVALPGIITITNLHPNEYLYFNQLAGGIPGAFREFELDYWINSYRQAIDYVNEIAPEGAVVAAYYGKGNIQNYIRDDLENAWLGKGDLGETDFLIVSTNLNYDQQFQAKYPQLILIHSIEVESVPITAIYRVQKP